MLVLTAKLEFILLPHEKGTTNSDTLIVLFRMLTYHNLLFHLNIEMLFDIIYGRQNRQIRVTFTTAWPTNIADFSK